jgi:three-Cys-motif partner protein
MQPKSTIWELEPHTAAKHHILRRYLQAWVPILSQGKFPLLVFIDGFSGPGRYSKGEEGSPIIAVKAVADQPKAISSKIDFHFIELNKSRADHLVEEIQSLNLPSNLSIKIYGQRKFQDAFPEVWNSYGGVSGRARPPTFVFIDPFGYKIPYEYVAQILKAQSCEVLINFMFEEINRFLSQEQQPENFDELFGCDDWRQGKLIKEPKERVKFLHDLYQRQLEKAGAKFVRSFAMRNERNTLDYFLFFGTSSELGLKKMKEAMWRIDESGTYTFSDSTDPLQTVFFTAEPDRKLLTKLLVERFSGKEPTRRDIERFVVQATPFRETHYKKILQELEKNQKIVPLNPPTGRRPCTYADEDLRFTFK